ncbi:MAG: Asp-tRNA(Asn)/Glu-tRNA(Gln) amidotransferase subunit GatC [Pseudomonadota bacterium]
MTKDQYNEEELKVSKDDVAYLARLYGLPIGEDELPEVAFRLNALLEEVEKLNELDLSHVEPIPMFLPVEEG